MIAELAQIPSIYKICSMTWIEDENDRIISTSDRFPFNALERHPQRRAAGFNERGNPGLWDRGEGLRIKYIFVPLCYVAQLFVARHDTEYGVKEGVNVPTVWHINAPFLISGYESALGRMEMLIDCKDVLTKGDGGAAVGIPGDELVQGNDSRFAEPSPAIDDAGLCRKTWFRLDEHIGLEERQIACGKLGSREP
jgi:hypothetical protein